MSPERDRIVDFCVSPREYEVLVALSVIEGKPIGHIVRIALAEHARSVINQPDFHETVSARVAQRQLEREHLLHAIDSTDDGRDRAIDSEYRS